MTDRGKVLQERSKQNGEELWRWRREREKGSAGG